MYSALDKVDYQNKATALKVLDFLLTAPRLASGHKVVHLNLTADHLIKEPKKGIPLRIFCWAVSFLCFLVILPSLALKNFFLAEQNEQIAKITNIAQKQNILPAEEEELEDKKNKFPEVPQANRVQVPTEPFVPQILQDSKRIEDLNRPEFVERYEALFGIFEIISQDYHGADRLRTDFYIENELHTNPLAASFYFNHHDNLVKEGFCYFKTHFCSDLEGADHWIREAILEYVEGGIHQTKIFIPLGVKSLGGGVPHALLLVIEPDAHDPQAARITYINSRVGGYKEFEDIICKTAKACYPSAKTTLVKNEVFQQADGSTCGVHMSANISELSKVDNVQEFVEQDKLLVRSTEEMILLYKHYQKTALEAWNAFLKTPQGPGMIKGFIENPTTQPLLEAIPPKAKEQLLNGHYELTTQMFLI